MKDQAKKTMQDTLEAGRAAIATFVSEHVKVAQYKDMDALEAALDAAKRSTKVVREKLGCVKVAVAHGQKLLKNYELEMAKRLRQQANIEAKANKDQHADDSLGKELPLVAKILVAEADGKPSFASGVCSDSSGLAEGKVYYVASTPTSQQAASAIMETAYYKAQHKWVKKQMVQSGMMTAACAITKPKVASAVMGPSCRPRHLFSWHMRARAGWCLCWRIHLMQTMVSHALGEA